MLPDYDLQCLIVRPSPIPNAPISTCWIASGARVRRAATAPASAPAPCSGRRCAFDLSDGRIPLLTTKRVSWKTIVAGAALVPDGETNIRPLCEQGVTIWTDWPLATLPARDRRGDRAGRVRGADRRRRGVRAAVGRPRPGLWGAVAALADLCGLLRRGLYRRDGDGIDQIAKLVHDIRTNPASRRLMFTGWNVAELDRDGAAALPYDLSVSSSPTGGCRGSCTSAPATSGSALPYNLVDGVAAAAHARAAMRSRAGRTRLVRRRRPSLREPRGELVETQLAREPRPWPTLRVCAPAGLDPRLPARGLRRRGYDPHPSIAAPIAV